jgi:hypothetical protein
LLEDERSMQILSLRSYEKNATELLKSSLPM